MGRHVGNRAVVLGGSMAGLLAARVLADSYAEVVIVERDQLTGVTTPRRGVPHGAHVHGLLARGQQILDMLFPGFTAEAVRSGVPTGDLGELRWFFNGRRLEPAATGLVCVSATRPVLEAQVRARVLALPNVRLRDGVDILSLVTTPDHLRVIAVRLQPQATGEPEIIQADLVVDATGRGSRTPAWLEDLGYRRPEEEKIRVDLSYTTRLFQLPDDDILRGDLSINPVSTPSHHRGAFLSRVEGGRCNVSLTGVLGDVAPAELPGYLAWARSLPVPDIYDVIRDCQPLDDGSVFRYPASARRRYEHLDRFPDRYLVVGDAACSFNPVYGQGMTIAAQEAMVLSDHLAAGTPPQPLSFFEDIAAVIDVAWNMSATADLGYPEIEGPRSPEVLIGNAYMGRLHAAAARDGELTRAFMRVAGLVDAPMHLMQPKVMFQVLGSDLLGALLTAHPELAEEAQRLSMGLLAHALSDAT